MKKTRIILLQSIVLMLPILYYISIWNKLPDSVPLHYNSSFQADSYGSKTEMFFALLFIALVGLGVNLLILNINKLDPKKRYENNLSLIIKFSWVLVIFMTLISSFIVYSTETYNKRDALQFDPRYIVSLVALLLTFLGNYMNNIKPNYFIGIRTPWNLEDEENWKKTHHLGSKIWFFGGLLLLVLSIILPENILSYITLAIVLPMAIIPMYYSYSLFRKKQRV